jgi:hypothetical protein
VTASEVAQLDRPPTRLDLNRCGIREHPVRRVEDDVVQLGRQLGDRGDEALALPLAGSLDHRHAPFVAPDRRRPERVVTERVIAVAVGVHHDPDGQRGEFAQVGLDLGRLAMADPRVDQQRRLIAQDDADVLVVELVAADEHAVADLGPDGHAGSLTTATVLDSTDN